MQSHVTRLELLADKYPTTERYPYTLPILRQTTHLDFTSPVTIFVGENGTGKSTLLEALARACDVHIWKLASGTRRLEVNQFEESLFAHLRVSWAGGKVPGSYFGSEIFKDFKFLLDEWASSDPGQLKYFGGSSLITKSHGQSLMAYFRARYELKGVYFLDEPETGLSPTSQLELLEIVTKNIKDGHAQFFIATHSPILLSLPGANLISFDHVPAKPVTYEETNHYRIYKRFLSRDGANSGE